MFVNVMFSYIVESLTHPQIDHTTCRHMLDTCSKKIRGLSITSKFFPQKFLFKVKFCVFSKFYILENNSPYGTILKCDIPP